MIYCYKLYKHVYVNIYWKAVNEQVHMQSEKQRSQYIRYNFITIKYN